MGFQAKCSSNTSKYVLYNNFKNFFVRYRYVNMNMFVNNRNNSNYIKRKLVGKANRVEHMAFSICIHIMYLNLFVRSLNWQ